MHNRNGHVLMRWLAVAVVGGLMSCAGPSLNRPSDGPLRIALKDGLHFYFAGQYDKAFEALERAYHRAVWLDDPEQIGWTACNLAACVLAADRTDEATAWIDRADYEWTRAGRSLVPVELLRAKQALARKDWMEAESFAARIFNARPLPEQQAAAHLLTAEALMGRNMRDAATREIDVAWPMVKSLKSEAMEAEWYRVAGENAMEAGRYQEAAPLFREEVDRWKRLGRYGLLGHAFRRLAEAHQGMKEYASAVDYAYRSARHYASRKRPMDALDSLNLAIALNGELDDPQWSALIRDVFDSINRQLIETDDRP